MEPPTSPNFRPPRPSGDSKLPVPDVAAPPFEGSIKRQPDPNATRKWLIVVSSIVATLTLGGIATFAAYLYVSNTPGYMLAAAMRSQLDSTGVAGDIRYSITGRAAVAGDFVAYSDLADPSKGALTLSLSQDASRVNAVLRLFSDGNYVQTAGLGNLGRLLGAMGIDNSWLDNDMAVRLGSLDGQWYSLTSDDTKQLADITPQHTVQGGLTSDIVATLERLYAAHPFIVVAQQYKDEQIGIAKTMHLRVVIDTAQLASYLHDVQSARLKALTLTDADIMALTKSNILGSWQAEAWIARSGKTFQQIRLTISQQHVTAASITVMFRPESLAVQRQSVERPDGAQSATVLLRGIHDILLGIPSASGSAR